MTISKRIFIIATIIFFSTSCTDDLKMTSLPVGKMESGVALNFDDESIKEWVGILPILNKYGAHATFNICLKYEVDPLVLNDEKIIELYHAGNEIGAHSVTHPSIVDYLKDHTVEELYKNEIIPSVQYFDKLGIPVTTFAYPGGVRTKYTDSLLFKYYCRLRGKTECLHEIEQSAFVLEYGKKMFYHYFYFDKKNPFGFKKIRQAIEIAKSKNAVLILLGHKPLQTATTDYNTFSISDLDSICSFIRQQNMRFYKMNEL
jgi:peptidoglycan/xylan/chitin deacetylase (PgdA/CDA1 family)